jgi:hypothetical protein
MCSKKTKLQAVANPAYAKKLVLAYYTICRILWQLVALIIYGVDAINTLTKIRFCAKIFQLLEGF